MSAGFSGGVAEGRVVVSWRRINPFWIFQPLEMGLILDAAKFIQSNISVSVFPSHSFPATPLVCLEEWNHFYKTDYCPFL